MWGIGGEGKTGGVSRQTTSGRTQGERCGSKQKQELYVGSVEGKRNCYSIGMHVPESEAPASSEFLSLLRISEFFGFQWQNLTEILRLLPKVLQSENEAVIMITSPLYNICLQQM